MRAPAPLACQGSYQSRSTLWPKAKRARLILKIFNSLRAAARADPRARARGPAASLCDILIIQTSIASIQKHAYTTARDEIHAPIFR